MNDIESKIRNAEMVPVPERLDRSIAHLVRMAEEHHGSRRHSWHPLWYTLVGCAAGLLLGIALGPVLHTAGGVPEVAPPTVVIVEPTAELERWVDGTTRAARRGFFERRHQELETTYVAGSPPDTAPSSL